MVKKLSPPPDIWEKIKHGAYKNQYLIYCRKSTDEAESQKNSIAYQKNENTRFAEREGLQIASITLTGFSKGGIISEKHSGFKESGDLTINADGSVQYQIDRPKFQQLLRLLNEGCFQGVISLCWDRISRNRRDDTIVRKLMRRGVDVRFASANYDQSSAGALHMDIDGMFAEHHSRVTSEKIRYALKRQREQGKCTHLAPLGYLNQGNADHKPHDPVRAPIIAEMFEKYATGNWSLHDLARFAASQGLTSAPRRKPRTAQELLDDDAEDLADRPKITRPLGANRISTILRNRFYLGEVKGPDGLFIPSSSHTPLVDLKTFELVQYHLGSRRISQHHPQKIDYAFRGFVRCANCGRAYTPYEKKGIHYYAAKCVAGCSNTRKNINATFLDDTVSAALQNMLVPPETLEYLDASADTEIALLIEKNRKRSEARERKKSRLEDDLNYLRSNQLTLLRLGTFNPETLQTEQQRLEAKLDALTHKDQADERTMRALVADVLKISELLKTLTALYEKANLHEKARIAQILISELRVGENTAQIKPQKRIEPLFSQTILKCGGEGWFSELVEQRSWVREVVARLSNQF